MSLKFTVVDAFTNKPFHGNPAGIVILPSNTNYDNHVLQGIAAELNLSQTAFIQQRVILQNEEGGALSCPIRDQERLHGASWSSFGLRWFTPTKEVRLCGHATLASSSLLFSDQSLVPADTHEIRFATLSGILVAKRLVSGKYQLEFPAGDIMRASENVVSKIGNVVKASSQDVGIVFVGVCGAGPYNQFVLVEVDNKVPLKGMTVDSGILKSLAPEHTVVILCQKPEDDSYDIDYRMFAPAAGVNEDPVCGSATSFASGYWAQRTNTASGDPMRIRAVSPRGGDVELIWEESTMTALIRGQARIASSGEIYI